MSKTVLASDAHKYLGRKIEFLFYPGWEDPWKMSGYLHHVTPVEGEVCLHIAESAPVFDDKFNPAGLGGYTVDRNTSIILVH